METKKISELTEVTSPTSTDVFPIVNDGETKKVQLTNVKTVLGVTQAETDIDGLDTRLTTAEGEIDTAQTDINNIVGYCVPIGGMVCYPGQTAPNGWLICDGSAISRTTYVDLFNVVGTAYGTGDGSTTFNLPNLKGKVAVGRDSSQTEFNAMGKTGGEYEHKLTQQEIPEITINPKYSSSTINVNPGSEATVPRNYPYDTISFGGGQAHNNLQPYIVLNYIIKY